jgi:hypothetical protein
MLDFPGKPIIVGCAALVLSLTGNVSSLADGRGRALGVDPSTTSTTTPGSSQSSDPQASQTGAQLSSGGNGVSGSRAGGDGELLTDIPLKDAWSLQLGVTIDPEQQSRSNGNGDINGRVGLGFRF